MTWSQLLKCIILLSAQSNVGLSCTLAWLHNDNAGIRNRTNCVFGYSSCEKMLPSACLQSESLFRSLWLRKTPHPHWKHWKEKQEKNFAKAAVSDPADNIRFQANSWSSTSSEVHTSKRLSKRIEVSQHGLHQCVRMIFSLVSCVWNKRNIRSSSRSVDLSYCRFVLRAVSSCMFLLLGFHPALLCLTSPLALSAASHRAFWQEIWIWDLALWVSGRSLLRVHFVLRT